MPPVFIVMIAEGIKNTPISCNIQKSDDKGPDTLRLYFFANQAEDYPQLYVYTMSINPVFNTGWSIKKIQLSSGDDLPPPMPKMGFFH